MKYVENMSVQENVVYDVLSRMKNSDVKEDLKVYKRKVKQYRRDFLKACNEVIQSMKANHRAWQTKIILGNAYDIATELFRVEDIIRDIWCSSLSFNEVAYQEYQDEVFQYRKKWLRLWTSTWMYIFDRTHRFMKLSNAQAHQPEKKKTEVFVLTPDLASQKTRSSVGLLFPVTIFRQGKERYGKNPVQQQLKSEQQKAEQDQKAKNQQQKFQNAEQQQKVQQERKPSQEQKPQRDPKTQRDQKVDQEPRDQKVQREPNIQQDQPAQPDQTVNQFQKIQKFCKPHLKVKIVGGKVVRVRIAKSRLQHLEKCELPEGAMELQITDIGSLETGVISGFNAADPHAKFVYNALSEKMAEFCQSDIGKQPYTPADDELCIVQLPQGQHLRAIMLQKVSGLGGPLANVKYIDYGHSERVPFTSIRRIPRQFVKGVPAVAAELIIKNFPKTVTSQMIINATTHMQVPDEDRLRLFITNNEKISAGSYTIEAPELLKAMMQ